MRSPSSSSTRGLPRRGSYASGFVAGFVVAAILLSSAAAIYFSGQERFIFTTGGACNCNDGNHQQEINDIPVIRSTVVAAKKPDPTQQQQVVETVSQPKAISKSFSDGLKLPKLLAIYFPQYHSDPLNENIWGKGFSDWVSLREAPKLNRMGLPIPRPTKELGYYDLTNTTIRKRQGELAKQYGVDGFVYHHYWFYDPTHPGPTLAAPLEGMLQDGHPNISFCFNWVAENWTDAWNRAPADPNLGVKVKSTAQKGRNETILQWQHFPTNPSDDRITGHYQWLRKFFRHPNYIMVEGKPLLMIYRIEQGIHLVLKRLQALAVQDGYPGLFMTLGTFSSNDILLPKGKGKGQDLTLTDENAVFDRITNYPYPYEWSKRRYSRIPEWCENIPTKIDHPRSNNVLGVVTAFDNTPRRPFNVSKVWKIGKGHTNDTVKRYEANLWHSIYYHACCFPPSQQVDQFILINAWNEWAEGMSMEPSDIHGKRFLEGLAKVKNQFSTCPAAKKSFGYYTAR